ncbi:hypothetical protein KALB_6500 [Kutzneria albida DSM 43870]|uniref:TIGR02679 family protein n=2 Tax=Kutzneria TaxID=43356 RepID=W5WNW3_9PSEU|nr:hypothetical protein KALB_6500 [Kutzneria albida DSM 43870]
MRGAMDEPRLRRLLGGEDTAWLLDRVRRRLELGKPVAGTVTLASAGVEQRRAVERLLGRRAGSGRSLTVSLEEIDAVLRVSGAAPEGLAAATRALLGTVPDRAAEATAWMAVYEPLAELAERRPELAAWRAWLDATGMIRRLTAGPADAARLVTELVRVLDRLPAAGVALGRLAAETTGDAHGLDDGKALATLTLAAVRVLAGAAPTGDGSTFERRSAWAAVGVHRDELSSSVLCVGLPGGVTTLVGRMVALAREAGEPCALTLRQLNRERSDLGVRDGHVWVCENPIVLASAADELGTRCPPLVCLSGQPSAAVLRLLDLLAETGAQLSYHGDFDWGGVRIGNTLRDRFGWRPWRFDAPSYRAALASAPGGTLAGRPVDAVWDPDLRPALEHHGIHVQEELVLPDLIADLSAAATVP